MPSKKNVTITFPSEQHAKDFMSWMYHYGALEYLSWIESSNGPMVDIKTDWDNFKLCAEEKDNDPDLLSYDNSN